MLQAWSQQPVSETCAWFKDVTAICLQPLVVWQSLAVVVLVTAAVGLAFSYTYLTTCLYLNCLHETATSPLQLPHHIQFG